jgi:hypothetical protein
MYRSVKKSIKKYNIARLFCCHKWLFESEKRNNTGDLNASESEELVLLV